MKFSARLDRENKIAYAAISPRTNLKMVNIFAKEINYKPVVFHSVGKNNHFIYHTNVIMSVSSNFSVVVLEAFLIRKKVKFY
ncbi:MAG: arginine deiminase-related protein [Arsenophonus sp. NEOnobi-MAG3]